MHPSNIPLRERLRSAITARQAALRNGRSHRKDQDALNAAIGRAQVFLASYPQATDERVREWCEVNYRDVAMIVPGNQPAALARLVFDALRVRAEVDARRSQREPQTDPKGHAQITTT